MHHDHSQEHQVYTYTFISKHRGAVIWSAFILFMLVFEFFFVSDSFSRLTLNQVIVVWIPVVALTVIHVLWDLIILKNHWNVEIGIKNIVFNRDEMEFEVPFSDISKIEEFPTSEDIYDKDFINNMMSSGVRIITSSGSKFLIFRKIKNFSAIKHHLEVNGIIAIGH